MDAAKQNEYKFTHGATKYSWKMCQYVIQNSNTTICNREFQKKKKEKKKEEELDIFFGKDEMCHSIP